MARMTKLKIKHAFGITEFTADGKSLEIRGKTGSGKTSIIDAIKLLLKNKPRRDCIIKTGETEAELFIEMDNAVTITRKIREGKADYKSIKENGREVQSPEAFLREIFTPLQLNPVEFMDMNEKEQNRIILDMIDFKWDMNWIKEKFGEIVPDVNYECSIIEVLFQIQSDDGYYFLQRQEANRESRNKLAFIEDLASKLPPKYDAAHWEKISLRDLHKKIEVINTHNKAIETAKNVVQNQENKMRGFDADRQIEINAVEKETSARRQSINSSIQELENQIKAYRTELETLEEKKADKFAVINQTYKANVAEYETLVTEHKATAEKEAIDTTRLSAEADEAEKMKAFINEYKSMQKYDEDVAKLKQLSEEYTEKIELARNLPAEILKVSKIPIKNMSVKDGKVLINGRPINNLSDGEVIDFCFDVCTQNEMILNLVLVDGMEKMSTAARESFYAKCKERNIQFIATRTTDDNDLTVIEV